MNNSTSDQGNLTQAQIDDLFSQNMTELDKMYAPAGSMVKNLIMELERNDRNTYIRLKDAVQGGHIVFYEFVQGDSTLVGRIGRTLGFKTVTDSKLEVRGG